VESQPSWRKGHISTRPPEGLAEEASDYVEAATEDLMEEEMVSKDVPSSDIEIIDPSSPKPRPQKGQKLVERTNESQNVSSKKKRAASTTLTKPVPAKRTKTPLAEVDDSDDSDDGLKFRFRRKR